MSELKLACGCRPEYGIACNTALDLMHEISTAMDFYGTTLGFKRFQIAKENLANHYRKGDFECLNARI